MIRIKNRLISTFLIMLIFSIMVVGCGTAAKKPVNPQSNQGTEPRTQNLNTAMDRVNLTDAEAKRLAQKFANMADEVNGVQKATVVVSDQPETVTDSKTRTRVTTIKNDRTITSPGPGKTVPDRVTMRGLVVMVGLDVDRSIINNTTEMERLKARVANKILRADNRISRVYVTTKPELMKRISNMASDIVKGKPLSNMRNDLNNLMDKMKGESSAF